MFYVTFVTSYVSIKLAAMNSVAMNSVAKFSLPAWFLDL